MKIISLSNWLKVIIKPVSWALSMTCLVLASAWSRYENQQTRWMAHFLEHMFFKWAQRYKSAKDVSTAIDSIWWDFNAFTWKEYAWYYVKCTRKDAPVAFDVLSDMLIAPTFDPAEIDKERGVILEEMNMYLDMPKYQVSWEAEKLIIWNQPLGWDQIGLKEVITTVKQETFHKIHKDLYTPDNMVISLSWDITEEEAVEYCNTYFSPLTWKKAYSWKQLENNISKDKILIVDKKTEQSHIVVQVKWTPGKDLENFWIQKVLSILLWGMMSSRMFLNIREAKWLCYYISTQTDDYTDFWIVSTSAWVDNKRVDLAIESIIEEYNAITKTPPTEEEIEKAKNFLIWKTLLSLEDTEARAHFYWKQLLLLWKIFSEKEMIDSIRKVSANELFEHAKRIFAPWSVYIAWIWPLWWLEDKWKSYLN